MLKIPWATLCTSAFCFGLMTLSANAQVVNLSQTAGFTFVCDGQPKQTTFAVARGFNANSNIGVTAGQINLYQQQGGLQYVILNISGNPNGSLATLAGGGSPTDHGNNNTTPFLTNYVVRTDAAGTVRFDIAGSCLGGAGTIAGFATVYFTNP